MLSPLVTQFLITKSHPLIKEIERLRYIILDSNDNLIENIKWNGPNYFTTDGDRFTMKIYPLKQIQLIFHRGAKVLEQPKEKLIDDGGLLTWKANDRAIISFKNLLEIEEHKELLKKIIIDWLKATP